MPKSNMLQDLLGIHGWRVAGRGIRIEEDGTVVVRVEPEPGSGRFCSRCGEGSLVGYDHLSPRRIRDFPVWGRRSFVEVSVARVWRRRRRAVVIERLDWLEPGAHRTLRYERYVAALCGLMPALDVAALEGIDKNAVYETDRKWLERREALRPARERSSGWESTRLRFAKATATRRCSTIRSGAK